MTPHLKRYFAINFGVCLFVVLVWLGYAFLSEQPIDDEFLGFPNIDGSPWIGNLIFDSFLVWCIFRAPPITIRIARYSTGFIALIGIGWLFVAPLVRSGTLHLTLEHFIGGYVWLSHFGFAVFWPTRSEAAS